MPPKKAASTANKSRTGNKTGSRIVSKIADKPELSEKNKMLLDRLVQFQETLKGQMDKNQAEHEERMKKLDEEEEAAFQNACRKYTEEQLNMTCPEFERFLEQQEAVVESKNEANVPPQNIEGPQHPEHNVYDIENEFSAPEVVKVRLNFGKKSKQKKASEARKSKAKPRRPSFANQFVTPTTSASALRRFVPKFMKSGIKESQPRAARPGEIVLSENGSPVLFRI
ncbi:uncharacterized protein LOC129596254 isoform X2 [Paramacrobiotus metropolitanus]|uniref:uncharacterized protein LOC129596254 isoform X2 n=1 Tax=Paramacrobiotus metropolitanus TaxID=2943436 RepID=UPI0024460A71|nr:uncharacterized protein LOC129596254 isoform X2 [Paramacrobiotus metropolitanus]